MVKDNEVKKMNQAKEKSVNFVMFFIRISHALVKISAASYYLQQVT